MEFCAGSRQNSGRSRARPLLCIPFMGKYKSTDERSIRLVDVQSQLPIPKRDIDLRRTFPGAPEKSWMHIQHSRKRPSIGSIPSSSTLWSQRIGIEQGFICQRWLVATAHQRWTLIGGRLGSRDSSPGPTHRRSKWSDWQRDDFVARTIISYPWPFSKSAYGADSYRRSGRDVGWTSPPTTQTEATHSIQPGNAERCATNCSSHDRRSTTPMTANPHWRRANFSIRSLFRVSGPLWSTIPNRSHDPFWNQDCQSSIPWLRHFSATAIADASIDILTVEERLRFFWKWVPEVDALLYDGRLLYTRTFWTRRAMETWSRRYLSSRTRRY